MEDLLDLEDLLQSKQDPYLWLPCGPWRSQTLIHAEPFRAALGETLHSLQLSSRLNSIASGGLGRT